MKSYGYDRTAEPGPCHDNELSSIVGVLDYSGGRGVNVMSIHDT